MRCREHRAILGALVVFAATLGSSGIAHAEVKVERSEGADSCPDAASFAEQVRDGGGEPASDTAADISVRFERTKQGYRSSVRVADGAYRAIVEDAPTCDGVAEAAALAVKLALDMEAARPVAPAPTPSVVDAPVAPRRESVPTAHVDEARAPLGELSATGVVAFGIASPVAPGVRAGAAIALDRRGHWSLGLTGLLLPAQSRTLGEGTVDLSVQGGGLEGCGRSRVGRSVLLALCTRFEAMRLQAEARGFPRSEAHARPLFGGTLLGRARAKVAGPVAVFVEVGALVPLVRQRFSIDTVGLVYDPPVLAATTGIGLAVDFE
ncbi:MAG: hypothetical protein KF764_33490 [Labilithrix sp.]|nr:hypothetical protein [Labilithrix sp.]